MSQVLEGVVRVKRVDSTFGNGFRYVGLHELPLLTGPGLVLILSSNLGSSIEDQFIQCW